MSSSNDNLFVVFPLLFHKLWIWLMWNKAKGFSSSSVKNRDFINLLVGLCPSWLPTLNLNLFSIWINNKIWVQSCPCTQVVNYIQIWKVKGNPLQYAWQRRLVGYSPWDWATNSWVTTKTNDCSLEAVNNIFLYFKVEIKLLKLHS